MDEQRGVGGSKGSGALQRQPGENPDGRSEPLAVDELLALGLRELGAGTVSEEAHTTENTPEPERRGSHADRRRDARRLSAFARRTALTYDAAVADMLVLSSHLPEVEFAAGEAVVREGGPSGGIWVLVSGALRVLKGDSQVNTITNPGALIGEMSVLLGTSHSATVEATEPSILRHAVDGRSLLASDPAITHLVAVGLAERLFFVTTYLADLTHQYADVPGLSMVSEVLSRLEQHAGPAASPGSAREPDPEY